MDTCIERRMRASAPTVFALAAAVEDWPRLLPHYRWVRLLGATVAGGRLVEMAARRPLLGRAGPGIPLRWTAVQTTDPTAHLIWFEHVAGVTRGMRVTWRIQATDAEGVSVQIRHVFEPRWPVPDGLVRLIVGEYFVGGVAARTLQRIAELAEARQATER